MTAARPIVHVLSGDLWGGAEAQMSLQLAALRERGVDVRAIFFNDSETSRRFIERGIPTVYAEERYGIRRCFQVLRAQLRTLEPALIVSHGYKENILSSVCSVLSGVPWVAVFHGLPESFSGAKAARAWLYYRLSEFAARVRACRLITVSDTVARGLGFTGDGRLRIIRNVVALSDPPAGGTLRDLSGSDAPAAVFAGRLVPVKRVDLLLDAFALCDDRRARLVILGDGPDAATLKAKAHALGLERQVSFLGFRNDATAIIGEGEVFVICSDSEGIPTVLLEAIALERKVVATAVGGIPEVLGLFPGYPAELVPPNDAQALGAAISRAFASGQKAPPETASLVREYFSPDVAARRHEEIYRELVRAD